ncbi:MAG: flagellar basal body P-ring formation protein FlgA [Rhodobacteraceae bacterium]|nr:flagellar basal body P-ring formation protein FlgA [Paracoccaceae bacterium]MCP5341313.1 flagellar basal body P-ring formation protein FlgA [Paracoccaceae bacterium]
MVSGLALVLVLATAFSGRAAEAQSVVATRTLRANTVLAAEDVTLASASIPGVASNETAVIGQEARVAIYQGRPIRAIDLGPPALVGRNQSVVLRYQSGALVITAEGRSLGRAGAGERIKVMNLTSHATVVGTVAPDGSVSVAR